MTNDGVLLRAIKSDSLTVLLYHNRMAVKTARVAFPPRNELTQVR
jgi:hypothetical protein